MAISANRLELLQIADAVAREKVIDRGIVVAAMEEAIAKAARSRYGAETDVHAEIHPRTGELKLSRHLHVVDEVENDATEISLVDARKRNPAAEVGDAIAETLPPFDFGRIAAQSAKQVIVQKVRDAERDRHGEDQPAVAGDAQAGREPLDRIEEEQRRIVRPGVEPAEVLALGEAQVDVRLQEEVEDLVVERHDEDGEQGDRQRRADDPDAQLPEVLGQGHDVVGRLHGRPLAAASERRAHVVGVSPAAAGAELDQFFDVSSLGGVVTKSIMAEARSGRATPRMAETPSGMLNSIGLQGPGIASFLENDLAWLQARGARAVVSIAGGSVEDYATLAKELRGRDVTVNAVAPGPTATPLFLDGKDEATIDRLGQVNPMGRLGAPADTAEVVAFLAGPGRWVNGQVIYANGGAI